MATVLKRVADGKIKVVDYTPDETRELTKAQKKSKTGKIKRPEFGFTCVLTDGS